MLNIEAKKRLELTAMSNLNGRSTGLGDVAIHLVPGGKYFMGHGNRVKVSNVKPGFSEIDNFSIAVPSLCLIGDCKLSSKELKEWVILNQGILKKLWEARDDSYDIADFLRDMVKV